MERKIESAFDKLAEVCKDVRNIKQVIEENEVFRGCGKGREEKVTEYDSCDISENSDDLVERMVREEFCREGNK